MSVVGTFEKWDPEMREAIRRCALSLASDPEVSKELEYWTEEPHEITEGTIDTVIDAVNCWVDNAVEEISQFMRGPKPDGGFRFSFRVLVGDKIVQVEALMIRLGVNAGNSSSEARASVGRLHDDCFIAYATGAVGWKKWRDHERLLATTSVGQLIAMGVVERVDDSVEGWFETDGKMGRTIYKEDEDDDNNPTRLTN